MRMASLLYQPYVIVISTSKIDLFVRLVVKTSQYQHLLHMMRPELYAPACLYIMCKWKMELSKTTSHANAMMGTCHRLPLSYS